VDQSIKNIYFYNHFHNGDIFLSKNFIKDVMDQLGNNYNYAYINNVHKKIMNIDIDHMPTSQYPSLSEIEEYHVDGETLYVNTWYGVSQHRFGIQSYNYVNHHLLWKIKYEKINIVLGTDIKIKNDIWYYVPDVDKNLIENIDPNIETLNRVLFCNGPANSGQSNLGNMQQIIEKLAVEFPSIAMVCTEKFNSDLKNIYFTDDVLERERLGENLIEIADFSQSCFIIVGKNSGPSTISHTKSNMKDAKKKFISCTHVDDRLYEGLNELNAEFHHVWSVNEEEIYSWVKEKINKILNPNKYLLREGTLRGFFSNAITILHSYKKLNQDHGVSVDNIYINPNDNFNLYGSKANDWFEGDNISYPEGDLIDYNSNTDYSLPQFMGKVDADFSDYMHFLKFNQRIVEQVEVSTKNIVDCFGIHYRSTDHDHKKPFDSYKESIKRFFNSDHHKSVFVCTDDKHVIPEIIDFIENDLGVSNIIIHDIIRNDNGTAIHSGNLSYDDSVKSADEAIIDVFCLSKCDIVVGLNSNISNFAIILNPNLKLYRLDNPEDKLI
jgi:hypothetical protein